MLIIRLFKKGKKNSPAFRVVLTQKTAGPKSGSFLEVLGSYDSRLKEVSLKKDRIEYWLSQGVQVSDTVHNLLVKEGLVKGEKIKIKLKAKKKAEKPEEKKEGGEEKPEETKEEPAEEAKPEEKQEKKAEEKPEEPKEEEKPKEENLDKSEPESKMEK